MIDKKHKQITIRVSEEWYDNEYKEIKKLLIDKGISFSQLVRSQIEQYLKNNQKK